MTQPQFRLTAERALIVSSDGHATAQMRDYRRYLDASAREEWLMLGENAIETFHHEGVALHDISDKIGTELELILTPPTQDFFPRGDVHKPLATAY